MGEKLKKVLGIFANVALWAVILLASLYAFTTLATRNDGQVSNFLGYTPLSVQTESMSPTFDAGDMIIIKTCDPAKLEEGDIITFHTIINAQYALNTHRIVKIEDFGGFRAFATKGDNNDMADTSEVSQGDIVGKYQFRIPKLGKVMDFLSSSIGFLLCIVLPMLIFFVYQIYNLIMVSMKLKKAMAAEAAEEAAKAQAQTTADDETARLKAELEEAKRKLAEAEAAKKEE